MRGMWVCGLMPLVLGGSAFAGTCNTPPVATADSYDAPGYQFAADVLRNDRDDDGEALTLTVLGENCVNHSVSTARGVVIVTPNAQLDQSGPATCTISYRITDERNGQASATVTIRLAPFFADGFESGTTDKWTSDTSAEPNR